MKSFSDKMEQMKMNSFYCQIKLNTLLVLKRDKNLTILLVMNRLKIILLGREVLTRPWPLTIILEGVLIAFP